jgi:hypothetical protein
VLLQQIQGTELQERRPGDRLERPAVGRKVHRPKWNVYRFAGLKRLEVLAQGDTEIVVQPGREDLRRDGHAGLIDVCERHSA